MTLALLICRTLLCCLALCVAGTGISPYVTRAAEVEAETKTEEEAVQVVAVRQGVGARRSPCPTPAACPARVARVASRLTDARTAVPSLRTLSVRMQV